MNTSSDLGAGWQTYRVTLALGVLTSLFLGLLLCGLAPQGGLPGYTNLLIYAPFDPDLATRALSSHDYGRPACAYKAPGEAKSIHACQDIAAVDVARWKSALEADWVFLVILPLALFAAGFGALVQRQNLRASILLGGLGMALLSVAIALDWTENQRLYGLLELAIDGELLPERSAAVLRNLTVAKVVAQILLAVYAIALTRRHDDPFFLRYATLGAGALLIWLVPSAWTACLVGAGILGYGWFVQRPSRIQPPPKDRTPTDIQRESYLLRRCGRLLSLGRTPLLLWLILLSLPLSVLPGIRFRELLGGVFRDFDLLQVAMTSFALWIDAFLLAIISGIYFDGIERRWNMLIGAPEPTSAPPPNGPHHPASARDERRNALTFPWALDEASLPPRPTFMALGLLPWTVGTLLLFGERQKAGGIYDDVGALVAIMVTGLFLTYLGLGIMRARKTWGVPASIFGVFYEQYPEVFKDRRTLRGLNVLSGLVTFAFFALFVAAAILADGLTAALPTSLMIFLGFGLLTLVVLAAEFYLSRFDASVPVVLIAAIAFVGLFINTDHYFIPIHTPVADASKALPPEEALQPPEGTSNVIVVSATGGGIAAAGWLTAAVHRLVCERPKSLEEIRAISAVSGGAVGTAFLLDMLARAPGRLTDSQKKQITRAAHLAATDDSLDALAFGLVARDLFRPILGRKFLSDNDRGHIQEEAWRKNAQIRWNELTSGAGDASTFPPCGEADRGTDAPVAAWTVSSTTGADRRPTTLNSLRELITDHRLPAPILNAVVLETGRRIMMTPIDFPGFPEATEPQRAHTFDEYYGLGTLDTDMSPADEDESVEVDLPLWSAARLSSVFPFVAPPARSDFGVSNPLKHSRTEHPRHWGHHLIDGGYSDNYGVASLIELLAAVDEQCHWCMRRMLILRLESFPRRTPALAEPASSFEAKVFGPMIASANVSKESAAFARNNGELHRMLDKLNAEGTADVCSVTLAPTCYDGPLSWKLTDPEKNDLRRVWGLEQYKPSTAGHGPDPRYPPKFEGRCSLEKDKEHLLRTLEAVAAYLEGGACPGHRGTQAIAIH